MKQRFYVMVECKKKLDPKEILFALRESRPQWGLMSASHAAQQSGREFPAEVVKVEIVLPAKSG